MIPADSFAFKALVVGLGAVVLRFVISYATSPLKAFPGPFVAKFTDLWRFWDYMTCTHTNNHRELHEKYGSAVRIGPSIIILNDPDLIKEVYSTRGDFHKVRCLPRFPTTTRCYRVKALTCTDRVTSTKSPTPPLRASVLRMFSARAAMCSMLAISSLIKSSSP